MPTGMMPNSVLRADRFKRLLDKRLAIGHRLRGSCWRRRGLRVYRRCVRARTHAHANEYECERTRTEWARVHEEVSPHTLTQRVFRGFHNYFGAAGFAGAVGATGAALSLSISSSSSADAVVSASKSDAIAFGSAKRVSSTVSNAADSIVSATV